MSGAAAPGKGVSVKTFANLQHTAALSRRFLPALLAAGLLAGLLDDSLQLVSDKRLNDRFPSAQRATLVSVSSMAFSVFMIPLSPVFGWWFSRL